MTINTSYDKEYLFQQTFLGASVKNWNTSMGFNSNSTTVNVTLVEDEANTRKPNAVDEGYHIWEKDTGFPEGATKNYTSTGDKFYAPITGEPAYFVYYKSLIPNCGKCYDTNVGTGDDVLGNYTEKPQYETEDTCVTAGFSWLKPSGENKQKQFNQERLEKVFEFNGIVNSYKRTKGTSGTVYEVNLVDPRQLLEGTQVILNGYAGTTAPPDKSFGMIDKFDDGKQTNARTLTNGYMGYYNILNAYGYYEYYDFGAALTNRNGFLWRKVLTACQAILQGKYDIAAGSDLERLGGPLYYVRDSRVDQVIKATEPINVHRYKVDLTELDNLSIDNGGLIPDEYRIKGEKMSLLALIQNICEMAGADFFVQLEQTGVLKKTDPDREYSGVIKIIPIPRNAPIEYGKIRKAIDTAHDDEVCGATGTSHPWTNRIVSESMGYEYKDPLSGIMMLGAERTRVVGVSDIGWFTRINAGMIRERFTAGSEKLQEFLPSMEHDGVTYGNPGWYNPHNFPYVRGHSYDQASGGVLGAISNVPASPSPASNDDYIAYGKSLVPNMNTAAGLANLAGPLPAGTKAPFMPTGTWGDGLLDIFPCWGFLKGVDKLKGPFASIALLQQRAEGIPIMGGFADDNPYNDFDTNEGIFTIFEYYNPYSTVNLPVSGRTMPVIGSSTSMVVKNPTGYEAKLPVCKNPYHSWCYSHGQAGPTYRYKLLNQKFDNRSSVFINEDCCFNNEISNHCLENPYMLRPQMKGGNLIGTYCKNPDGNKGRLVSWDWHIPPVNVIPINLAGTGWRGGPVTNNGDYSHFYYTTVTALRAAIEGEESWREYTIIFEPWLHCNMGASTCPMQMGTTTAAANAFDLSGSVHSSITCETYTIEDSQAGTIPAGEGVGSCKKDENGDIKYTKPITVMGGSSVHSFNRWLGVQHTGVATDANAGGDGRMQEVEIDTGTGAGTKVQGATVESTLSEVYQRVAKVANEFYGRKYLVPLPFTPNEVGQHLRQISDEVYQFESSWEPSQSGWVDIDITTPELAKRYPQNISFFDQSGKLMPFAVYPNMHKQVISKNMSSIYFPNGGFPIELDPTQYHVTNLMPANSMGGDSIGKVYSKAMVDEQVYWLWNPTTYAIQTGRATSGTVKPYAMIEIASPAVYNDTDMVQAMVPTYGGGLNGVPANSFWRRNVGALNSFISADGQINRYATLAAIPLWRVDDGRTLFHGDANHPRAAFNTFNYIGDNDKEGSGRFSLAAAMFKPWTVGVPMKSNRYRWGPWAEGRGFGKARLEIDNTFAPENFGGFDNMELAATAKLQAAVEPAGATNGVANESGTVTLAGLPSTLDTNKPTIMGLQLLDTGPYVTDVSINIGDNGVTTTYTMKTQRKAHKLNEIYENRMRQGAEDFIQLAHDLANGFQPI
tara:strand:- start:908 stop:5107 length:4200 start_codon:yes stop_codon:yes gene_type:complete